RPSRGAAAAGPPPLRRSAGTPPAAGCARRRPGPRRPRRRPRPGRRRRRRSARRGCPGWSPRRRRSTTSSCVRPRRDGGGKGRWTPRDYLRGGADLPNARSPRLPGGVMKGASRARRGLLGEPHGAQDLLHGRLGHFVLDALGAEQVPGDEVACAVLEREGDRLALAVALALLRGAVGVGGGESALDAGCDGVRLQLDRLLALLVGLLVTAVDPPRHAGLGRLVGRLGAVLTAGARRDEGGVLLAAVLVVVGGAPLGLEVGGGGDRGAVHLAVLVLPLEADAGAGRL